MSQTRVGFVGLDYGHQSAFAETLEHFPDVEITCTCEPDPEFETGSGAFGDVPFYRDPEALFDTEDIDVAWVSIPNRDAPGVVESAVDHGLDVFSEKTMARTADELDPVVDTVRRNEATVGIAYPWRKHPASGELRSRVARGFFGDIRAVHAHWTTSTLDARLRGSTKAYDEELSRGGILQWLGCHQIDLIQWLLDEPIVRVNANMTRHHPDVTVEDGATVEFETASGTIGSLDAGYYRREGNDLGIEMYGTESNCEWDMVGIGADSTTVVFDSRRRDWKSAPRRSQTYHTPDVSGYGGQVGVDFVEQFFAARDGEEPTPADIDDAVRVLRVLDACYDSDRHDEWVSTEL